MTRVGKVGSDVEFQLQRAWNPLQRRSHVKASEELASEEVSLGGTFAGPMSHHGHGLSEPSSRLTGQLFLMMPIYTLRLSKTNMKYVQNFDTGKKAWNFNHIVDYLT